MSEIINNNDSYIVRTNGRIYVKLGGRYIALIDEDGNLNVKLKTSISTVSNFNDINSEGLYYYNGNIYAYANGSPYLLTGGGGSGDVINQVLSGDLRAVTSNAVYVTTENIKNNLANKVLPFEEFKTISSVVYNPTDITEGRVLYSLNLKCFILENTVGGRTTYYTNWKGSEKYQTINSENVSQITLKPDVLYLFTNLSTGQTSARTLYIAKSNGDLTSILTDRDLNDVLTLDDVDTEITSSSSKPVAASAIYTALSKLGSIEYFDGTLSAEETIDIIDSATTSNDILILYSYKYKTFIAKYNNNYYKRWNTADKFFDGTTPNKKILFVCDNTLYFWNNDLVTVNVDNINDCIIYVDLYMKGGLLPTPSSSDLGKYAIVESNTYQLYRAEQFNNVISYTAKSFSKNRLYINDNKLYLWNGSELVQVGISEFNLLIAPFDGVINSATIQESSYTGTGDVFYITSLQRFAFRVISLNQTKYYDNWSDSGLYFGENRKPRKDTIYVNNGVGYVFDGTNGLIAIGGSAPVTADEITISTKNASGGNAAIHLASNPKSTVNSVGAIHVTDSTLPSSVSQNTKYIIYKDITTGNVDGLNYIQLAPGTKIVPNGGIPKVPVVGGEMSWVHSSDIGMIQVTEGEIESGEYDEEVGKVNREILRQVVASKYNLILDGVYYVYFPMYPYTFNSKGAKVAVAGGVTDYQSDYAILVNKDFKIQGGGIIFPYSIFYLSHCNFSADDTTFTAVNPGYPLIIADTRATLIGNVLFNNCTFSTNGIRAKAIVASGSNVAPRSYENPAYRWMGTVIPEIIDYYTEKYRSEAGDAIITVASKPQNNYKEYGISVSWPGRSAFTVEMHPAGNPIYMPNPDGTYVFVVDASGTDTHDSQIGYFKDWNDLDDETEKPKVKKDELDNVIYYAAVAIPLCDGQGMESFIVDGCHFEKCNISLSSITVKNNLVVRNSTFKGQDGTCIEISTNNSLSYAEDWIALGAPLIVENNKFEGVGYPVGIDSPSGYHCPLLSETKVTYFRNNVVSNFIGGKGTHVYDNYISSCEVYVENNIFENIVGVYRPYWETVTDKTYPDKTRITGNAYAFYEVVQGLLKSKGIIWTLYTKTYFEEHGEYPYRLVRIFKNNRWYLRRSEIEDKIIERLKYYYEGECESEHGGTVGAAKAALKNARPEVFVGDEIDYKKFVDLFAFASDFAGMTNTMLVERYEISNNEFDFGGAVVATSYDVNNNIKEYIISNNTFKARLFPSTSKEYADWYALRKDKLEKEDSNTHKIYTTKQYAEHYTTALLAIRPTNISKVTIENNTIESEVSTRINLLGVYGADSLDYLNIRNNTFINCDYRCMCPAQVTGYDDNGAITGVQLFYWGEVYANRCDITNNVTKDSDANSDVCAISSRPEYPSSAPTYVARGCVLVNTMSLKYNFSEGSIKLDSNQTEATDYSLGLTAPKGNGTLTLTSNKIVRPADLLPDSQLNNLQDFRGTGGTVPNMFLSTSYVDMWTSNMYTALKYKEDFTLSIPNNSGIIIACIRDSKYEAGTHAITITYTKNGIQKKKRMEITTWAYSGPSGVRPSVILVRDFTGKRMSAVSNTSKGWYHLYTIDDLGLNVMVRSLALTDYLNPIGLVTLFTDDNGTTNDVNTSITIQVRKIPVKGYYQVIAPNPLTNIDFSYNNETAIKEFMPEGSIVPSSWREDKNELARGTSVSGFYIRDNSMTNILSPADKGFWVLDSETLRKYTWNGTSWDAEKRIVSLTQAEYDAIVTKDADTLYLITDSQS